jgi:hypothetical protein
MSKIIPGQSFVPDQADQAFISANCAGPNIGLLGQPAAKTLRVGGRHFTEGRESGQ